MYAIIRAGGKQHKVTKGDVIEVERIKDSSRPLEFDPLLVVDDKGKTLATPADLRGMRVTATVVGEAHGPKVEVYKFKNKSGYRRHTGHRQKYTSVKIEDIKLSSGATPAPAATNREVKEDDGT